jgi:hypothetical protein
MTVEGKVGTTASETGVVNGGTVGIGVTEVVTEGTAAIVGNTEVTIAESPAENGESTEENTARSTGVIETATRCGVTVATIVATAGAGITTRSRAARGTTRIGSRVVTEIGTTRGENRGTVVVVVDRRDVTAMRVVHQNERPVSISARVERRGSRNSRSRSSQAGAVR